MGVARLLYEFFSSGSRLNTMLVFDDCDMEAADIFLNSPGSGTSGYASVDDNSQSLCDISSTKSEDMDLELCPLDSLQPLCNKKSGLHDFSIKTPLRRCNSMDFRKKLFQSQNVSPYDRDSRPVRKASKMRKLRTTEDENMLEHGPSPPPTHHQLRIKDAVERLEHSELIADGTKTYAMPTVQSKHKDLKTVSPATISNLIRGHYADTVDEYAIIDCRYPYEYDGGHINGAVNLYTYEQITDLLEQTTRTAVTDRRRIVIVHCEFSSQRGPSLLRFLRSQDRMMNSEHYPKLFYPEIYIMDGGYKAFFEQHQDDCYPRNYTPMLHADHSIDLRHFRSKAKSWTAGEKKRTRSLRF